MYNIIEELNATNGSNYKMSVLKIHKDNELLKRVLKMTYDKVTFTYGISMKNIKKPSKYYGKITLDNALNLLEEQFVTRNITGHAAILSLQSLLENLNEEDAKVLEGVINRDLKINMGRSNINKVFKGLITKPLYMRCDVYSEDTMKLENGCPVLDKKGIPKIKKGTSRNINFKNGALLQLKADGTFREFHVSDTGVLSNSRSGEEYCYPLIFDEMKSFKTGTYHGELTVKLDTDLLKKILPKIIKSDKKNGTDDAKELQERFAEEGEFILPRSIGNGLINSSECPHENLVLDLWDYITPEEYARAGKKDKKNPCKTTYEERYSELLTIVPVYKDRIINIIETHEVFSLKDALEQVSKWMQDELEGGILKDKSGVFADTTSKHQLKLKLEVECDMRITGFTEGTGKNADYFGAVTFENDEGTIKGKVGVSSMKETLRDWFHENRNSLIGKIMEVQFNDFSKARGHDYKALSHPRFIELRNDKDTPDTLEKVEENRLMAMQLKKRIK